MSLLTAVLAYLLISVVATLALARFMGVGSGR